MPEALVVAYVGSESDGVTLGSVLDHQIGRQVRVVTTGMKRLRSVLADERLDCVVCGPSLSEGDLQQVVFDVVDRRDNVPIFDASGDVAAVPDRIEIHHFDPDAGPAVHAREILGEVLEAGECSPERGPFSYFAVDSEWSVIDWDPDLSTWTTWEPGEALGTPVWTVFSEWEGTEFEEVCRKASGTDSEECVRIFHEESRKWFDVYVVGYRNGGLDIYVLDVTEFQNAGGKIEGTGARFEETLDRITDAFFALDNQERFVFLNSQAEFLLDVEAKEMTGIRFWDAFPAAVSTTFYEEFQDAMETQEPTSFEEYYKPLDKWFEVNAYPSSEGLSVFLRDITEQVVLQEKLEQLHDVTRELVVAESDREIARKTVEATEEILDFQMVSVWRHDGSNTTLEPLAWSDEIDERIDEMEPLGRDSEFIWEVYEMGEPRTMGFVPATTTTSHHPGKVQSELLVPIGEYGVMGAYADERDAFEENDVRLFKILSSTVESAFSRAERERQLARRNERLNNFASIVSHDLRNPLNVASSHLELARLKGEPEPHLDNIEEALFRMENLVEDILARARGDDELQREELSLAQAARSSWGNVDTEEATLQLDADARFEGDYDRVQQLFENLFRNAVEHGGEGVTVRIGPTEDGFYVADDGPGIPEEQRDGIFDQGVTYAESGTGYGLAIVSDIVEGHGWTVEVTDSSDDGARFDVRNVYSLVRSKETA